MMTKKSTKKIEAATEIGAASAPGSWPHGQHAPTNGRVLVTPEMATEWLKANRSNRHVNKNGVARASAAIKSGRWKFNGQTVIFSVTWRLLDGQHRLMAIVEAGIAVEVLVWTGITDDAMVTIDTGVAGARGPAEAWCIANGHTPEKNVIARVNACYGALTGEMPRTADEFGRAYTAFGEGVLATAETFAAHRSRLSRASIVAGFVVAWKEHPAETLAAAGSYLSGEGLSKGDPMLVLRNWAFGQRSGGGSGERSAETRKAMSLVLSRVRAERRTQARAQGDTRDIGRMLKAHGL